jgi:hypothetical protein
MPAKNDKRLNKPPLPDFTDVFEEEFENGPADRSNAEKAPPVDARSDKYEAAMLEIQELRAKASGPGAMLVVIVFIVLGRLALYGAVENWGTAAAAEGILANLVAGAGSAVIFGYWAWEAWRQCAWLMIPSAVLVLVTMVICGAAILDGPQGENVGPAAFLAIVALLIGASPIFIRLIKHTMEFLNHPFKKLGGKLHDSQ